MQSLIFKPDTSLYRLVSWSVILLFTGVILTAFWNIFFFGASGNITYGYGKPDIIFLLMSHPGQYIPFIIFFLPFVFRFKQLQWKKVDTHNTIRPLTLFCGVVICWILCMDRYNFYLDSWFALDRFLLVLFCAGIFWHPIFIPLLTWSAGLFYVQYFAPFDFSYTYVLKPLMDSLLICHGLVLFGFLGIRSRQLLTMVIMMQLCAYFFTAVSKIAISPNGFNWVTDNELFLLPLNTHLRGWLRGADDHFYHTLSSFFLHYGSAIAALTLALESLCIIALANRKLTIWVLVSLNVMHIVVGALCGIIFWTWFCLNTCLIIFLIAKPELPIFFSGNFGWLKSIILVSIGIFIFHPISIAWFDSRFQWFTEIEVKTVNGEIFSYNKNNFGGYSYVFVHDALTNAIPEKLPGYNGYSAMWQEAMTYKNINLGNADSLVSIYAKSNYDSAGESKLVNFIKIYITNYNMHLKDVSDISRCSAPEQLYMFQPSMPAVPKGQRISQLTMWLKEYVYTEGSYKEIKLKKILQENF